MKNMQRKVNEAVKQATESMSTVTDKCGARLKARDELQEWLEKQEELRKNPEKAGSNIFTYRSKKQGAGTRADEDFAANMSLINDVQLLRLKSKKSYSGLPTQANSVNDEIQKWSYFEKMERLKKKVLQVHGNIKLDSSKLEPRKGLSTDVIHLTDGIQVAHPDWQAERT